MKQKQMGEGDVELIPGPVATGFDEIVARVSALTGGGCIVRILDESGDFAAVAADHLDESRRRDLLRLIDAPPLAAPAGWVGQALERRCTLRLPEVDSNSLREVGLPDDGRLGDVMVVPWPQRNAVIVAARDAMVGPFSSLHRRQVEQLALGWPTNGDARKDPDERSPESFDPGAHGLLDATTAAIWVVDETCATIYVNEAASELVGRPAADLLGTRIYEHLGPAPGRPRDGFSGTEPTERPLVAADGAITWVIATARPLGDGRGGFAGTVHSLVDVDERRRREVGLRVRLQRQRALYELAAEAARGEPLERLMSTATAMIAEQLDVELSGIGSFDPEASEIRPLAYTGLPDAEMRTGDGDPLPRALPEKSVLRATLVDREPILIDDFDEQALYEPGPLLAELEVRSAALVPFADGTGAVGAGSPRPRAVDGEAIKLLRSVAHLLEPRWGER